jgi:hypothetical protein
MKDGRLNKCAECTVKDVAEWRLKNKGCRQREHIRNREKKGFRTREQYLKERKDNSPFKTVEQKKAHLCYLQAKYRSSKNNATPTWLTEQDKQDIKYHYNIAAYFTWLSGGFVQHHVDHIVPIQGKEVCGLHVPWNLQVLIASDNLRKSNKLIEM